MSDIQVDVQSAPVNPPNGSGIIYGDTNGYICFKNSNAIFGTYQRAQVPAPQASAQAPAAATRTYITGSNIPISSNKMQSNTCFKWKIGLSKTGAGAGTSVFDIAVGTNASTADAARVSFTKPAGTAVADEGWIEIIAVMRSVGASGIMVGEFSMTHNLQTTGHLTVQQSVLTAISAGFDTTVAGLQVGLCVTSAASELFTINVMIGEGFNI
jgi:hypothetical protein